MSEKARPYLSTSELNKGVFGAVLRKGAPRLKYYTTETLVKYGENCRIWDWREEIILKKVKGTPIKYINCYKRVSDHVTLSVWSLDGKSKTKMELSGLDAGLYKVPKKSK